MAENPRSSTTAKNSRQRQAGEWSRETQNELATNIRNELGTLEQGIAAYRKVQRGDTLGAIVKGLTGKLNYSMGVDYRSNRIRENKPTKLSDANLIYEPNQYVWVENGKVVVSDTPPTPKDAVNKPPAAAPAKPVVPSEPTAPSAPVQTPPVAPPVTPPVTPPVAPPVVPPVVVAPVTPPEFTTIPGAAYRRLNPPEPSNRVPPGEEPNRPLRPEDPPRQLTPPNRTPLLPPDSPNRPLLPTETPRLLPPPDGQKIPPQPERPLLPQPNEPKPLPSPDRAIVPSVDPQRPFPETGNPDPK